MKSTFGIIAGVSIGLAVMYFLLMEPSLRHDAGYDGMEDAAEGAFGWGTKQRVKGRSKSLAGTVKEGIGRLTGNDNLADEGVLDQAAGAAKDAAGRVGHAVGQTIHDLNR
jgi:uncharacterized protein YjbJ (UPF0337 family)